MLLERLDERALAEARRRGRLVRLRADLGEVEHLALVEVGQTIAVLILVDVVLVALHPVGAEEAVEALDLAGHAEHHVTVRVRPHDVGGDPVEHRRCHLRRDGARPDELVQAGLLGRQVTSDAVGSAQDRRGTDRLVGLLGTLRRVRRTARLVERVAVAVLGADEPGDLAERLVGEVEGVGAHVGDEADLLAASERDALVELLRHRHRLPRAEADAGRLALQGRRLERRLRVALLLSPSHLGDGVGEPLGAGHERVRLLLRPHHTEVGARRVVLALEVLRGGEAQPVDADEPGAHVLLADIAPEEPGEVEVGLRHERPDLLLSVDDQPQRHRLDATGGDP